jgi:DNA uptake protein ComE-like DNA-binding protein
MTLWMLAAIMVAATIFSERVRQAVNLAQQQQQHTSALLDIKSTQAEILFRLGVTPISIYGLGDDPEGKNIALDDRLYRGLGNTTVQLQDNRGLLNLNIALDPQLLRLLAIANVAPEKRGMLIDTLRDYMDEDSVKRINGAEEPEYRALGLPPPRNEKLLTPFEARSIIGWRDEPQLWENNYLPDLTTVSSAVAINPNTARKEVLETLPGVTSEIADAIMASRNLQPIGSPDVIAQLAGGAPGEFMLSVIPFPANSMRVTHRSADLPWAIQYNVSLQPNSDKSPWRIDYYFKIRQNTPPATSIPVSASLQDKTSIFATPGQNDNNASEIPELPPRRTLPITAGSSFSSPVR